MDVLIEMRTQLRFRDAANGGVRLPHGYIVQIVEVAEDAYLPELGHAGQQGEAYGPVHGLQHAVEGFEHVPESVLRLLVVQVL